jgi:hypothetical protein
MTGQNLIDWIKENKAEDYEVRVIDVDEGYYGHTERVEADPYLTKERIRRWTGKGKYEYIEKHYIDL